MKKLFIALSLIVFTAGCASNDNNDTVGTRSYDKTALLTNWADNIIIPSYTNYQAKVNALSVSATTFTTAPTTDNLANLRQTWLDAYKAYQYVAMFDIGKAEDLSLLASANTYPASAAGITANVTSGNYNLNTFAQNDKQGFPGLDYLLNGLADSDTDITAFYTTDTNAAKYKQYLTAVVTRLKETADAVVADWNGGYRDTFVNNSGSSISSSVNKMTNKFVKNFEKDVRTPKIDIPAGILSEGLLYSDKVEAYYKNDISKELLNDAVKASQNFFNGKYFASDATGPGLKGYLDAVNAVRDGQNLSTIINTQYTASFTAIAALNNSFSEQITTDNTKMQAAHNALQKNVVYFKSDMLSALNITIDYVDGDGD